MKNLIMLLLLASSKVIFAQAVLITPNQGDFKTGSQASINLRSNSTRTYLTFSPNGVYKGYVGVNNGTNDVDFGTGSGNNFGRLNLVIKATPKLVIDSDGSVRIINLSGSGTRSLRVDNIGTLTTQPTTFVQNVPFAAFRPAAVESGPGVTFSVNGDGTVYCSTGSSPLFAPVNLPDGATITKVTAYFVDNSASKDVRIELNRNGVSSLSYSASDFISEISSSGASSSVQAIDDETITSGLIDNSNYFYLARVYLPTGWDGLNILIKGMVITYQY